MNTKRITFERDHVINGKRYAKGSQYDATPEFVKALQTGKIPFKDISTEQKREPKIVTKSIETNNFTEQPNQGEI